MRRRKSNLRSFCQGFLLAGLPIVAFAGADYLFAPPSDNIQSEAILRSQAGARPGPVGPARPVVGQSARGARGNANAVLTAEKTSAVRVADHAGQSPQSSDPYSSLVASIQRELRRVGCYAGDADGVWNSQTTLAMRSFNDSVHVSLASDQADYILLTLLQGHNGRACSRACDSATGGSAQCIDKTIEARRLPAASPVTRQATVAEGDHRPATSAGVARQGAPAWTTAATHGPSPAPAAQPVLRHEEVAVAPSAEPLPGRMSIGAPASKEPDAPQTVASAPIEAPHAEHAPAVVKPRHAPVARPSAPSVSKQSRLSRTFVELSRNSP